MCQRFNAFDEIRDRRSKILSKDRGGLGKNYEGHDVALNLHLTVLIS